MSPLPTQAEGAKLFWADSNSDSDQDEGFEQWVEDELLWVHSRADDWGSFSEYL